MRGIEAYEECQSPNHPTGYEVVCATVPRYSRNFPVSRKTVGSRDSMFGKCRVVVIIILQDELGRFSLEKEQLPVIEH